MMKEQQEKINSLSQYEAIFILTEINSCINSIRELNDFNPSNQLEKLTKEMWLMRHTNNLEVAVSRIGYTAKDFLGQ